MSLQPISRSRDLKRLRDEGYHVDIHTGHLLLRDVPFVTSEKTIGRGIVVAAQFNLSGDVTQAPTDHVVLFGGGTPCDRHGQRLTKIIIEDMPGQDLGGGVVVHHRFSSKPNPMYPDYYELFTTYVNLVQSHAQAIDPSADARTFPAYEDEDDESVFRYIDTASSRAEIGAISEKLKINSVGIVGLGGTGSYVLDLIAKTPVREIHLFDGDTFLSHNAFRSPGAPSLEYLRTKPSKVQHLADLYDPMRRGIVPHPEFISEANVDQLRSMDFAFLCLDAGGTKSLLMTTLAEAQVPFIDVGMGVEATNGLLGGILRVTTSTAQNREAARTRVSFADAGVGDDYDQNIQVADLNALNASLAVIKWKKLFGFYRDLDHEFHSTYTIDGNHLLNEESSGS